MLYTAYKQTVLTRFCNNSISPGDSPYVSYPLAPGLAPRCNSTTVEARPPSGPRSASPIQASSAQACSIP